MLINIVINHRRTDDVWDSETVTDLRFVFANSLTVVETVAASRVKFVLYLILCVRAYISI